MTALRNFKPITKKYKNLPFYSTLLKNPKKQLMYGIPILQIRKLRHRDNKEQVHPENLLPSTNRNFFH